MATSQKPPQKPKGGKKKPDTKSKYDAPIAKFVNVRLVRWLVGMTAAVVELLRRVWGG
jgi:hypothetical protein